jgi:MoaA/NifB/PqqE/SkfB family radical SAM enzyme
MYRLAKEEGMELGVLITKKFNKDKRTTGYIIAYIEPNGLVHRCEFTDRIRIWVFQNFQIRILISVNVFCWKNYFADICSSKNECHVLCNRNGIT